MKKALFPVLSILLWGMTAVVFCQNANPSIADFERARIAFERYMELLDKGATPAEIAVARDEFLRARARLGEYGDSLFGQVERVEQVYRNEISNERPAVNRNIPSEEKLDSWFGEESRLKERSIPGKLGAFLRSLIGEPSLDDLLYEADKLSRAGNHEMAKEILLRAYFMNNQDLRVQRMLVRELAYTGRTLEDSNESAGRFQSPEDVFIATTREQISERKFRQALHEITDPYVENRVAFKIGGFDTVEQYRAKLAKGNRVELHADEYFEKYVNPRTWTWYSEKARKEYESIGGIDCGGFVQRVYQGLSKKAGVPFPPELASKVPGKTLRNPKFSKPLREDGKIPPAAAKPGDCIWLREHDGWGHVFIYEGTDQLGRVWICEASGEGCVMRRPMPDRYLQYYGGTFRFNNMDEIRARLGKI